MNLIKFRKFAYIFSGALVILSIAALLLWGLKWGIDFTGGTLVEAEFLVDRPSVEAMRERLSDQKWGGINIQPVGDKNVILRLRDITEEEHPVLLASLAGQDDYAEAVREIRFNSIGPVIGNELKRRSLTAVALVLLMIVLFIAFAFRHVSYLVPSWKYGIAAIIALMHDVIIPTGVFAVLGHFKGVELDILFVTAILTILGFSVHDTIVVFDRIRENLKRQNASRSKFEEIVGGSLRQTIGRSLATSFAILIVLFAVYFFGAASTKYFALALIIGITSGAYSSIFVASPLLVTWEKLSAKYK